MTKFSNITALHLIRAARSELPPMGSPRFERILDTRIERVPTIAAHAMIPQDRHLAFAREVIGPSETLHLQTPKNHRRSQRNPPIISHVASPERVATECLALGGDLFTVSPEELMLELSHELTVDQFLKVAYELCGCYGKPAPPPAERVLAKAPPITSPELIRSFVESLGRAKGKPALQKLLCFIIPNSASPMETTLVIMLTLPPRLGGYGLPHPLLNPKLQIAEQGADKTSLFLDLYWPEHQFAVEYDSDQHHFLDLNAVYHDAGRRVLLAKMGIETLVLTKGQVQTLDKLDQAAEAIAAKLGKKLQLNRRDYRERRAQLHRSLMPYFYRGDEVPVECYGLRP